MPRNLVELEISMNHEYNKKNIGDKTNKVIILEL